MARVLIVDDERSVRSILVRQLERRGHTCREASSVEEARELLAQRSFALILCDVNMPGESGLDLVRPVLMTAPDTAAVMMSGTVSSDLVHAGLEYGAYSYIIKPFSAEEVLISVDSALRRRQLEMENRFYTHRLQEAVLERTQELRVSREETIRRLSSAVEYRSAEVGRHIESMSVCCGVLARHLGVDPNRSELIRIASPLHDLGKIAIPDHILLKRDALTPDERATIEEHAELGYRMLAHSGTEPLDTAASIARTHHERIDGTGYPCGLRGDEIPLEGRIAAVADVFDALTSDRVYRPRWSLEDAMELMREGRGNYFEPEFIDCLEDSLPEILRGKAEAEERSADGLAGNPLFPGMAG